MSSWKLCYHLSDSHIDETSKVRFFYLECLRATLLVCSHIVLPCTTSTETVLLGVSIENQTALSDLGSQLLRLFKFMCGSLHRTVNGLIVLSILDGNWHGLSFESWQLFCLDELTGRIKKVFLCEIGAIHVRLS